MTIASQRFGNTFPWKRMKQSNIRTVGVGELYLVRPEVRSFHESSVASDSSLGIHKRVQHSAAEC
jgi:hypothetical protein